MDNPSFQLFGLRAHLLLEDEHGEFEVARPFCMDERANVTIDTNRVVEAIDARRVQHRHKRPVY